MSPFLALLGSPAMSALAPLLGIERTCDFMSTRPNRRVRIFIPLCRSARRYGGRWCVNPASPIAQHPPKNRLAVELTRRELCSGQCRRTRCHWPRFDSQPVVHALAVEARVGLAANDQGASTATGESRRGNILRAQIGGAGVLAPKPSRIAGQTQARSLRQCRAIAIFRLLIRVW